MPLTVDLDSRLQPLSILQTPHSHLASHVHMASPYTLLIFFHAHQLQNRPDFRDREKFHAVTRGAIELPGGYDGYPGYDCYPEANDYPDTRGYPT